MQSTSTNDTRPEPRWLTGLVHAEPRAPLMFPYLVYLLILAGQDLIPPSGWPIFIGFHIVMTVAVCWQFRRHFPPLGRAHFVTASVIGLLACAWWVAGQHWLDRSRVFGLSLGGRLPLYPGESRVVDPQSELGSGSLFWAFASLKMLRAVTVVPFVEELLWRGFLLRAFVNWNHYDQVAWGRFSGRAFWGTAILSTIQHPDNWVVSIGCWLIFNGLFYWKKSLLCVMVCHAITNLALYLYVLRAHDWRFW